MAPPLVAGLLLPPLYTGVGGTPKAHHCLSRVPSTIYSSDSIIIVLRQSPASVEHHHRHHAVVLTKLSCEALQDRSLRDVIELNVC